MDLLIKCNVGPDEKLARLGLGAAALTAAFLVHPQAARIGLGILGAFGVTTAMTRYCPINQLIGRDKCQPAVRSVRELARRF